MTEDNVTSISTGELLYQRGWRQGTIFDLPGAGYAINRLPRAGCEGLCVCQPRTLKSTDRLIVVTQDCDIRFGPDREPCLEALVCKHQTNPAILSGADGNSPRWFLVDEANKLVADARWRTVIQKEVLLSVDPERWPRGDSQYRRFVRWLGRRPTRPAIPDPLVEAFEKPARAALNLLIGDYPDVGQALNRVVGEIRWRLLSSDSGKSPFVISLVILLKPETLTSEETDAVEMLQETVRDGLDPNLVSILQPVRWATEEQISLREYMEATPLYLEYLTYQGEELLGAEPIS